MTRENPLFITSCVCVKWHYRLLASRFRPSLSLFVRYSSGVVTIYWHKVLLENVAMADKKGDSAGRVKDRDEKAEVWTCPICGEVGFGQLSPIKHPRVACGLYLRKNFGALRPEYRNFHDTYGAGAKP